MKTSSRHSFVASLAVIYLLPVSVAFAGVEDSVHMPKVEQGKSEVELKIGTLDKRGEGRNSVAEISYGYGVTKSWFTELSLDYAREPGTGTKYDAIEWENRFEITNARRFPLDIGFLAEINRFKDRSEGYTLRAGPLLQKDIEPVQLNFNLLFERRYRAATSTPTELGYQWQAKYRWNPSLELGVQGFGEVGPWTNWLPRSEQSHRVGPAIFGNVSLSRDHEVNYNAAYLTDPYSKARSHGFRMEATLKF